MEKECGTVFSQSNTDDTGLDSNTRTQNQELDNHRTNEMCYTVVQGNCVYLFVNGQQLRLLVVGRLALRRNGTSECEKNVVDHMLGYPVCTSSADEHARCPND